MALLPNLVRARRKRLNLYCSLIHPQRLKRRGLGVAVEDGVDVFHDVAADFEELAFVFDGDEGAFHAVVAGELEGFGEGTDFLDVALNAHVTEERCGGGGLVGRCEFKQWISPFLFDQK